MQQAAIFIEDLSLMARVGILPQERLAPQRLLISFKAQLALEQWPISALDQSLSYAQVAQTIEEVVAAQHWDLLEDLAFAIQKALAAYKIISQASLELRKPDILPQCKALGFSLNWDCRASRDHAL